MIVFFVNNLWPRLSGHRSKWKMTKRDIFCFLLGLLMLSYLVHKDGSVVFFFGPTSLPRILIPLLQHLQNFIRLLFHTFHPSLSPGLFLLASFSLFLFFSSSFRSRICNIMLRNLYRISWYLGHFPSCSWSSWSWLLLDSLSLGCWKGSFVVTWLSVGFLLLLQVFDVLVENLFMHYSITLWYALSSQDSFPSTWFLESSNFSCTVSYEHAIIDRDNDMIET